VAETIARGRDHCEAAVLEEGDHFTAAVLEDRPLHGRCFIALRASSLCEDLAGVLAVRGLGGQIEILDLPLQHADLIGLQTIAKGGDFQWNELVYNHLCKGIDGPAGDRVDIPAG